MVSLALSHCCKVSAAATTYTNDRYLNTYALDVSSDDYLILITARRRTIRILDTDIYLATDFKVFPIRPPSSNLADKLSTHKADETFLLSLVKGHLYSGPFYYTYGGIDLTSRMQRQDLNDTRPMWQRVRSQSH